MTVEVIIPFRDRGRDPLRRANLKRVLQHWDGYGARVNITADGLDGDQPFNRSRAYNLAIAASPADIFILTESDMLIDYAQIDAAVEAAAATPGLVVPFTERHEHDPDASQAIREHRLDWRTATATVVRPKPRRVGAINVISRRTYNLVGRYDEQFCGTWWDDRAMHRAFDICAGPTRWIDGPSHHLYHLPGYEGAHLTDADRAATEANRRRFGMYKRATTPEQIRALTNAQARIQ